MERGDSMNVHRDKVVTKAVPYVVAISAVSGLILSLIAVGDLGGLLLRFCVPFVAGFAILGIYTFIYRDEGLLTARMTAAILLVAPFIVSVALAAFTYYKMPEIMDILSRFMMTKTNLVIMVFFSVYALNALMLFTSHGVISTVVAYFRKYTAKIYLSIERISNDRNDSLKNKISRWVYDIPEIIDVQCIEMEPVQQNDGFPLRMFASMAFSIFILGLTISSYVFLNPIFASTFTLDEAVIVTVIITFFVPVLIIPWFITKDTGARIKSQAKDYYLWKGMRKRLYEGFFAFMMFLSMFAIYVFLGYDVERTYFTYAGYVSITAFLSTFYAFVYANYYHKQFRKGIIDSFNDAKRQ
ncbi:MAG: hypothetical protein LBV13_02200 [Methanomassiliicoccaceae archaeon]|jgi:hypothetical protein|nr:hypothetical protein [Methanomassiliicoccaceae archaeon]